MTLEPGSGYAVGASSSATVFLADDPPVVSLDVIDNAADEAGQDPMVFRFSRTGGNLSQTLTLQAEIDNTSTISFTGGGVDVSGSDGGTLVVFDRFDIPAGQSSHDLTYTPLLDNVVEPTEQVDISLLSGGYVIGTPNTASATLEDDPPVVSVTVVEPLARESGPPGILRFNRTGGNPGQTLEVNARFNDSMTATIGSDFSTNDGGTLQVFDLVRIFAGELSREIEFSAIQDNIVEEDETLIVDILSGNYVVGAPASGTIILSKDQLFADSFERPEVEPKSCTLVQTGALDAGAFERVGFQALDRQTGTIWLVCEPAQQFDWDSDVCVGTQPVTATDHQAMVDLFNAGLLGENGNISSWRLATKAEKVATGAKGTCLVR